MNDVDFPYVVLRNWENLPHTAITNGHSDLDLLVYDIDHWTELYPNAKRVYPEPRVQFQMTIGSENVYIDVRSVGDGYYPDRYAQEILDTREFNSKGFFTPDPVHFRTALAYHAVHHKNENKYERWIGDATVEDILEALKESFIGYSLPKDPTVGRYNQYWKGATAIVEKDTGIVLKRQTGYNKYNLIDNEYRILTELESIHFPKVIDKKEGELILEDCGQALTVDTLPVDWKQQLVAIVSDLQAHNVQHRDITPQNLMLKDGIIKLIDFGWARFEEDEPDSPPECLGYPYKPSWGWDDVFSMRKIIKEYDYLKEEVLK